MNDISGTGGSTDPRSKCPKLSGLPLFLLIDPYIREPRLVEINATAASGLGVLKAAREQAWQRPVYMATRRPPKIESAQAPYLVAMDGGDDPLLSEAMAEAQEERRRSVRGPVCVHTIGALIEADLLPEELLARVEALWTFSLHLEKSFLRIGDPRVMWLLSHLYSPAELQAWLGPIAKWHILCLNGTWESLSGAGDDALIQEESELYRRDQRLTDLKLSKARLRMTPHHVQRLLHSGTVTQSLAEIARQALGRGSVLPASFPGRDDCERAWVAAQQCRQVFLISYPDDMVAYVWRAMSDPGFHARCLVPGPWADALTNARENPGSLEQQLARHDTARHAPDSASHPLHLLD